METAQDMSPQIRALVGKRVETSIGAVQVWESGDNFKVNVHRMLKDGNQNTTLTVARTGRVIDSKTVKSALEDVSASGQTNFPGDYDPITSPAIHSLRDVLRAVTEANKS